MRRVLKGRAGLALAFILGLLIAGAGTATAAKLITGRQIKDGSISSNDLSKALRAQLAKAGVAGLKGDTGTQGATGPPGSQGPQGLKGDTGVRADTGPSTGPAGGDLAGSYPNPTLRPPALVAIKQQQPAPATAINCLTVFATFCGDANTGSYWNQPGAGASYLGYYVEPSGFVQFQGGIQQVGTPSLRVLVLPPGRRPSANLSLPITHVGNETAADSLEIYPDGEVYVQSATRSSGQVWDLTSVRFRIGG